MKLAKEQVIERLHEMSIGEVPAMFTMRDEQLWKAWKLIGNFIRVTLANGDSVNIPGVGIISRKLIKDRIGQNPKTGEKIKVPPFYIIKVKPSEDFRR